MVQFEIGETYRLSNVTNFNDFGKKVIVSGRSIRGMQFYLITDIGEYPIYIDDATEFIVVGESDDSPVVLATDKVGITYN